IRERDNAAFGHPRHGFDILGKAAAIGSEASGQSGRFVLRARGEEAFLAIETSAAGSMVEAHHPIARRPLGYAATHRNDCACELVTKNLRGFDVTLEDFLDVGAADAACGDFDKHFAVAYFGHGDFFDAHDPLVAQDASAHGFRDGPERFQRLWHGSEAAHVAETSSTSGWEIFVQF